MEAKHDGLVVCGDGCSSTVDASVGWDGVSAEIVVSIVKVSIDGELAESTTPAAASVWNSGTTVDDDFDGDEVSVVGTSRSVTFFVTWSQAVQQS